MSYHGAGLAGEPDVVAADSPCKDRPTGSTLPAGLFSVGGIRRCVNLAEVDTSLELKKLVGDVTGTPLFEHPTWTPADEAALRAWAGERFGLLQQTSARWAFPSSEGLVELLRHCMVTKQSGSSVYYENECIQAYPRLSPLVQWVMQGHREGGPEELVVQAPVFGMPGHPDDHGGDEPPPPDDDEPPPEHPPLEASAGNGLLWVTLTAAAAYGVFRLLAKRRARRGTLTA